MINYYQPNLIHFLQPKRYSLPANIKQYYYHSFEDGLWDLLTKKTIPIGSTLLIPNFYCLDVLKNITNHGYNYVLYPLDKHFQIKPELFIEIIKKNNPAVIIIFHVAGITSQLIDNQSWKQSLKPHTLVLEDCVHRLIDPEKIELTDSNHFLMDSLRKVSPFPGSFLYGTKTGLHFSQSTYGLVSLDVWRTSILFLVFRLFLEISFALKIASLTRFCFDVLLYEHDEIIGDNMKPLKGLSLFRWLHRWLDTSKTKQKKYEQVLTYRHCLASLYTESTDVYEIAIPQSDYSLLHVYPLGLEKNKYKGLITYLHKEGCIVWPKFTDCEWSQNQHVLFLPLGQQISTSEIAFLCHHLTVWFKKHSSNFAQKK